MTVSTPAHAPHDAVGLQEALPVFAGELAALIRVQEQAGLGFAAPSSVALYGAQPLLLHQACNAVFATRSPSSRRSLVILR